MDKISSPAIPLNSTYPVTGKAPLQTAKDIKETPQKAESAPPEPQDTVETTRQERIKIAMDKTWINVSEMVEMGSAAFIGEVVGSAVALCAIGGIWPVAIGGAIGAGGGILLHKMGWDKKVFGGVKTAMGIALTPFVLAAKGIKAGVGKLIDLVKPSGKKDEKEIKGTGGAKGSSHSGSVKSAGQEGALIADGDGAEAVSAQAETDAKKSILGTLGKAFGTAAKAIKAVPKFLYPSIQNATPVEQKMIEETLDQLPLRAVTSTNTITIDPNLAKDMQAAGLARNLFFDRPISLDKGHMAITNMNLNKGVLVHELGHSIDFQSSPVPGVGMSNLSPWGKGPYVYDPTIDTPDDLYASTSHWEDFAQSHKFYHLEPETLKATSPEKFQAMEKFYEPNLYDKVMDHSGIREMGKKLAKAIDKVPYLRPALSVLGTIMGPIEMNIGADQIEKGIKEADATKKYQGKMAMAQGIAFSTKILAPVGLGIALSKFIVDKKLEKGKWNIDQAHKFASKALAAITGPVGMIYSAYVDEILKDPEGKHLDEFTYDNKQPRGFTEKLSQGLGMAQLSAREVDTGRELPKEEAKLTWGDRIFLTKVAVGAGIAGIAGTVAGYVGGSVAGAAIGGVVGGPVGALVGGLLGKVAGTMYLSHQGAKVGAKVGKFFDKESREASKRVAADKAAHVQQEKSDKVKTE